MSSLVIRASHGRTTAPICVVGRILENEVRIFPIFNFHARKCNWDAPTVSFYEIDTMYVLQSSLKLLCSFLSLFCVFLPLVTRASTSTISLRNSMENQSLWPLQNATPCITGVYFRLHMRTRLAILPHCKFCSW